MKAVFIYFSAVNETLFERTVSINSDHFTEMDFFQSNFDFETIFNVNFSELFKMEKDYFVS